MNQEAIRLLVILASLALGAETETDEALAEMEALRRTLMRQNRAFTPRDDIDARGNAHPVVIRYHETARGRAVMEEFLRHPPDWWHTAEEG